MTTHEERIERAAQDHCTLTSRFWETSTAYEQTAHRMIVGRIVAAYLGDDDVYVLDKHEWAMAPVTWPGGPTLKQFIEHGVLVPLRDAPEVEK